MLLNNLFSLVCFAFACLGAVAVMLVVGLFFLQRAIRDAAAKADKVTVDATPAAETRWARADLAPAPSLPETPEATLSCPACGGKNQPGSATCTYCGRNL